MKLIHLLILLTLTLTTHANATCPTALTQTLTQIETPNLSYHCEENTATLNIPPSEKPYTITLNPHTLPVTPTKPFYGLAAYYNHIYFLSIQKNHVTRLSPNDTLQLTENNWLGVAGRFNVALFKAHHATVNLTEHSLTFSWPPNTPVTLNISIITKTDLSIADLRYQHLWGWLAALSKTVEWSLVNIQQHIVSNWGWAIVIFAVLLKLLLLPISLMTTRLQHQVSRYQSILAPQLAEITSNYDGEEAHKRIMAAYKSLGITPFYTLKPMIGALIQIPILVAIFNTLGGMPQLAGAHFLWIKDLAYPDAVAQLPFFIPFLGNTINLLPIIMTIITVLSTTVFQNPHAPAVQLKRQKRHLYLMAAAFFLLFYPFPAAMVLYWTLANVLYAIQQRLLK